MNGVRSTEEEDTTSFKIVSKGRSTRGRVVAGLAILVIFAALIILVRYLLAPVHISDMYVRRVDQASDGSSLNIKRGERLTVSFSFKRARVATPLTLEVVQGGDVVRSVELLALRGTEQDQPSGARSVAIVKSASDALEEGDYTVRIVSSDGKRLASENFTISGN